MSALSFTGHRWVHRPDPPESARLARDHGLHPLAAACLARRSDPDGAARWLAPSQDHLHDPYSMLGMDRAVERIRRAARDGEKVRIVTDYDVDGTTSSLILQRALELAGVGGVDYHIPDRFDEGYGFSPRAAEAAAAAGVRLVITADIGVRDHEAVGRAAAGGADVIVCDHHLPAGESVPAEAFAVLCPPQAGCGYPNRAIAACGVSLKLAQALLAGHPRLPAILRSMLKMAAIGTVADVVDLSTPENRAIVALGLAELRRGPHSPGLRALLEVSGLGEGRITSTDLGFRIGPRINAAGRLESATAVIELFAERDPAAALEKARALDRLNRERQQLQEKLERRCRKDLDGAAHSDFPVLWGPEADGWHRGVVGIVAARVRDRVHRPVALASVEGENARGSVRSVGSVHAVRALDGAADFLEKYGGHPAAAGFSLPAARLPDLARRLDAWVRENVPAGDLVPVLEIDGTCAPGAIGADLVRSVEALAPFGKGNPTPRFRVAGVRPSRVREMGNGHLSFDAGGVDAVWWGGAQFAPALQAEVDLVGSVEIDRWQGRERVRLSVRDGAGPA